MSFFRKHWLAIVFAFITGFIVAMPNWVYINTDSYRGLPMMYSDAEHSYLAKINAAYEGCILNCNPYIREYGYGYPHSNSSLSEIVLATPGIILGISAINLKIFYDFFLPFILFLLIYFLIFRITSHEWWSIIGASFMLLGYNIFNATELINLPYIWNVVNVDYTQFLHFSRPVNPQFSTIILFIYFHVLLSAISGRTKKWFILLALIYGFSFYTYLFTSAFITVVQVVWITICLLRKEWKMTLYLCLSALGGLIIATPQFFDAYRLFSHPYYFTIPTQYLVLSHVPHITLVGIILFLTSIVFSLIYIKKYGHITPSAYLILSLVTSCFIARNQHVVSGIIMQYDHFEKFLFTPILIIVCCFCTNIFFHRKFHFIYIFLALIPILDSSIIQYRSYQYWLPYTDKMQKVVPVLDWLNENAPKGSVIYTSDELSSLIPVYTHNYIVWTTLAAQWMSTPGRAENFIKAQVSDSKMLEIGQKYGVDYYIEEKDNRYFVKGWRGDTITVIN